MMAWRIWAQSFLLLFSEIITIFKYWKMLRIRISNSEFSKNKWIKRSWRILFKERFSESGWNKVTSHLARVSIYTHAFAMVVSDKLRYSQLSFQYLDLQFNQCGDLLTAIQILLLRFTKKAIRNVFDALIGAFKSNILKKKTNK
jgi:hypothetical protein